MMSDPLTVPSQTVTFSGNWPSSAMSTIQGKSLNVTDQSGRTSVRELNGADLATLTLRGFKLSVAHDVSTKGRRRSKFRVDVEKVDAAAVVHSAACYLIIDQEVSVSAEHTVALTYAFGALLDLLVTPSGAGAFSSSTVATELLNGEM
jgi:hypothetical protein